MMFENYSNYFLISRRFVKNQVIKNGERALNQCKERTHTQKHKKCTYVCVYRNQLKLTAVQYENVIKVNY